MREFTAAIQHDVDTLVTLPQDGAVVVCFEEEEGPTDFNVLVYLHEGRVVVEIEDLVVPPLAPVEVRHAERTVFNYQPRKV